MIVPNNRRILYRPTENNLGVIYWAGRFSRFADPNKWLMLLPWLHCVKQEISLDMQTIEISLRDVMTKDLIAIDIDLKVFFKIDLRQVSADFLPQALRISQLPPESWGALVRTNTTDIIRNTIFIANTFTYLMSPVGSKYLKRAISSHISDRVVRMGIVVNPRFGISIMNLQPNATYQKALQEAQSAASLGQAAIERIRPILEALRQQNPDAAQALLLGILAAVNKDGKIPPMVLPGDFEREYSSFFGRNNGHNRQDQGNASPRQGNNGHHPEEVIV